MNFFHFLLCLLIFLWIAGKYLKIYLVNLLNLTIFLIKFDLIIVLFLSLEFLTHLFIILHLSLIVLLLICEKNLFSLSYGASPQLYSPSYAHEWKFLCYVLMSSSLLCRDNGSLSHHILIMENAPLSIISATMSNLKNYLTTKAKNDLLLKTNNYDEIWNCYR